MFAIYIDARFQISTCTFGPAAVYYTCHWVALWCIVKWNCSEAMWVFLLSEIAAVRHFVEHPELSKGKRCQVQFSMEHQCQTVWQSSLTS